MKKFLAVFILNLVAIAVFGQRVGVGTTEPMARFAVDSGMIIDQSNSNKGNLSQGGALLFGSDYKTGIANSRVAGTTMRSSLGFFTGNLRRVIIDSIGYVGINVSDPAYRLHVGGSIYGSSNLYVAGNLGIGTTTPSYDLDGPSHARIINLGLGGATPTASYPLDVLGNTRLQHVRIEGTLNPNNPLVIGNNTSIEGSLTVNGGNGIVRSTSSTQMFIRRRSISLIATLTANQTGVTGFLSFSENFASVTVLVGHCKGTENGGGDWAKVLITPFEVDVTNNRCRFKVTNVSSATISFDADWEILLVGN